MDVRPYGLEETHVLPCLCMRKKSSKQTASAEAVISVLALEAIELIERYAPLAVFLKSEWVKAGVEAT